MSESNRISTIIPAYITSSINVQQFKRAVESVFLQTSLPAELIISDNSPNLEACEVFKKIITAEYSVEVKLIDARSHTGISRNSNYGVRHATQEILHILHQDDFLPDSATYAQVHQCFSEYLHERWLVVSRVQGKDFINPRDDDFMLFGYNTLGGPSCVFWKRDYFLLFREDLKYFLDVDLYARQYSMNGLPFFLKDTSVNLNQLGNRVSNILTKDEKLAELDLLIETNNHRLSDIKIVDVLRRSSMSEVGEIIVSAKIKSASGFEDAITAYTARFLLKFWIQVRRYGISRYIRNILQKLLR